MNLPPIDADQLALDAVSPGEALVLSLAYSRAGRRVDSRTALDHFQELVGATPAHRAARAARASRLGLGDRIVDLTDADLARLAAALDAEVPDQEQQDLIARVADAEGEHHGEA